MSRSSTPKTTPRKRRERGSLQIDDVVAAAIRVIDRDGLSSMTMPALAQEMAVPVTSIYWHFRTKDDLIIAVGERMIQEFYESLPPVDPTKPWDVEVRSYCVNMRRHLLSHQAFLELMATRSKRLWANTLIGTLITNRVEAELQVFTAAGFSAIEAVKMYTSLSTYVRGFAMIQVRYEQEAVDPVVLDIAAARMARLDPDRHPVISSLESFDEAMRFDEAQFSTGLDLIIEGIRVRLAEPIKPARSRAKRN